MKIEDLDIKISQRAHREVCDRVGRCKEQIAKAIGELLDTDVRCGENCFNAYDHKELKQVVGILASDDYNPGWPVRLWEQRKSAIREDILSTMDTLQKMMAAKYESKPGDAAPAETEDKTNG
jgi:hypothetical protein